MVAGLPMAVCTNYIWGRGVAALPNMSREFWSVFIASVCNVATILITNKMWVALDTELLPPTTG